MRRLVAVLAAAGAAAGAHADNSSVPSTAGIGTASGADIYEHICQACHMAQGQGAVGAGHYPKLAGDPALVSWQYVALTVLNGKNGMPWFGWPSGQVVFGAGHLSDAQVADVVNYVRSHFGNKYKGNVTADQVAALPHPGTPSERQQPAGRK
jgi:mono/diheme cytochrome c family protein